MSVHPREFPISLKLSDKKLIESLDEVKSDVLNLIEIQRTLRLVSLF